MSKDLNDNIDNIPLQGETEEPVGDSEHLEIKFQQIFFKDLSSSMPTLFEQLSAKDAQINKLNSTVNALIERNDELQRKNVHVDTTEYYTINGTSNIPLSSPTTDWWQVATKASLLLLLLMASLALGIYAYNVNSPNTAPTPEEMIANGNYELLSNYLEQREDYYEVISEYQNQVQDMQIEKEEKEAEIADLSHTIDTLSSALAILSIQLDKEGRKSETIDVLGKQLEQKDAALLSLDKERDSLNRIIRAEKAKVKELDEKARLLEALNKMQQNQTGAFNGVWQNVLYMSGFFILFCIAFFIFDRRYRGLNSSEKATS